MCARTPRLDRPRQLILMMDMTLTTALFLAVSSCGLVYASTDAPCPVGWFGENCQYKCRCIGKDCDEEGQCGHGSRCVTGWFGASCQYKNLIGTYKTVPKEEEDNLDDENDDTCSDNLQLMTLRLNAQAPVTWFRIVVRKLAPETLSNLTVWIRRKKDDDCFVHSTYIECDEPRNIIIDHRTVDIYCRSNNLVHELLLTGSAIRNLCSVYVSAGRNVALKQFAWQSSTRQNLPGPASAAVDGNTSGIYSDNSCTHTAMDDRSPQWTVRFANPVLINRFQIFNRQDCCSERISFFSLSTLTATNDTVLDFTHTSDTPTEKYIVLTLPSSEPVTYLTLAAHNSWQGHVVLTLCEVEAYGDSVCPDGVFGRNCERPCNCSIWGEACMVSSGNCPSGCAVGRYGEGCTQECPHLHWGVDCLKKCSRQCVNRTCDMYTGDCTHGCKPGYQLRDCTQVCPDGRYGQNCRQTCPVNCLLGKCRPTNGKCNACVPGFRGDTCDAVCASGMYGASCNSRCSRRCVGNTCDHVTGHCHRCVPGNTGDMCENRVY